LLEWMVNPWMQIQVPEEDSAILYAQPPSSIASGAELPSAPLIPVTVTRCPCSRLPSSSSVSKLCLSMSSCFPSATLFRPYPSVPHTHPTFAARLTSFLGAAMPIWGCHFWKCPVSPTRRPHGPPRPRQARQYRRAAEVDTPWYSVHLLALMAVLDIQHGNFCDSTGDAVPADAHTLSPYHTNPRFPHTAAEVNNPRGTMGNPGRARASGAHTPGCLHGVVSATASVQTSRARVALGLVNGSRVAEW